MEMTKAQKTQLALSTVGFATGIWLAYSNKKSGWAYLGYGLGLSMVGSIIGYGIGNVAFTKTEPVENKEETQTI